MTLCSFCSAATAVCANFLRRSIGVALLIAYTATAAGIPLPSGLRPQNSTEVYPCSAGVCGCTSADHCWRSCCCHTLAERLAWARKNSVQPPAFAIAQARSAGLDVSWWSGHTHRGTAASSKKCCVAKAQHISDSCCQKSLAKSSAKPARACCAKAADKDACNEHQFGDWMAGMEMPWPLAELAFGRAAADPNAIGPSI